MRRAALVRSAVLLGCNSQDAEDLVQVTLTRCLNRWWRVSRADNPDAYVYRILINAFRDERARKWHGERPSAELPERAAPEQDHLTGLAVRSALAAMTRDHWEVLVLRYYADLSEHDTALALGVAPGTVKSRTARALRALETRVRIAGTSDPIGGGGRC